MRVFVAAALAALALVAAGCGGAVSGIASGSATGTGAASLVPADAGAFAVVDTDLNSSQWQRVDALTKNFPAHATLLDQINTELQKHGLTWKDDVQPALGPEVDVALIGSDDAVFTKPHDAAKLSALADKLSTAQEHYTVQKIGGWSVVSSAQDVFDKVRSAQSGQSLADSPAFKTAWAQVGGEALARAYANGAALAKMPQLQKLAGAGQWLSARVRADADALHVDVVAKPSGSAPATTTQPLLHDIPSGAALAVAFHGGADLAGKLGALTQSGASSPLAGIAPLVSGDGVAYVRPSGLVPEIAIELTPKDPQKALASARAALATVQGSVPLPLSAQISNGKLVIADGPAAVGALGGGSKLTADRAYKDAVNAAGVPAKTTFLAYADVTQLAPFIQLAAGQLGGGKAADPTLGQNLAHVGTVVAWGTSDAGLAKLGVWIRPR